MHMHTAHQKISILSIKFPYINVFTIFSGFFSSLLDLTNRETRALNTEATSCPSMPLEPAPPRDDPKLVA